MACKVGQIIRRGSSTWLVRIYVGHDPKTQRFWGICPRWRFYAHLPRTRIDLNSSMSASA
jgi:hypothetical protein